MHSQFDSELADCCGARRANFLLLHCHLQEVAMPDGFSRSNAVFGISDQHALQHIHGLRVDTRVPCVLIVDVHLLVALVHLVVAGPFEQRLPGEQHVEDDSCREDVALRFHVFAFTQLDNFGGDVAGGAAAEEEVLVEVDISGQTEVHDHWFQGVRVAQHDVLGFEIPVHDAGGVHVVHAVEQSEQKLPDLGGREVAVAFLDAGEELSACEEFEDDVDGVVGFEDGFELEDVGVGFLAELTHYGQFVYQAFFPVFGAETGLLREGFHCELPAVGQAFDLVDGGEVSLPQLLEGLEHLVEAFLVDSAGEAEGPPLYNFTAAVEAAAAEVVKEQPDSYLVGTQVVLFLQNGGELELEGYGEVGDGLAVRGGRAQQQRAVQQGQQAVGGGGVSGEGEVVVEDGLLGGGGGGGWEGDGLEDGLPALLLLGGFRIHLSKSSKDLYFKLVPRNSYIPHPPPPPVPLNTSHSFPYTPPLHQPHPALLPIALRLHMLSR